MKLMNFKKIEEYQVGAFSFAQFYQLMRCDEPFIIKNINFGKCTTNWTLDYLEDKLKDESIVIHESDNPDLDFLSKNFRYKTCLFSELCQKLKTKQDSYVYLRSTNRNTRAKKSARIEDDFPVLSQDLDPPCFIPFGNNSLYHSSVLRIASSKVQIWTHFDLYDNVLCQIVGKKRIILLPPKDTGFLYCNGDKSPVNDFDNWDELVKQYPLTQKCSPYLCHLNPCDLIFIPSLWWHNIRTVQSDMVDEPYSIGFNIFWRDTTVEAESLYPQSDVYGNKNLGPYESALSNIDRAITHLDRLPGKYKMFYKLLILESFKNKLFR